MSIDTCNKVDLHIIPLDKDDNSVLTKAPLETVIRNKHAQG